MRKIITVIGARPQFIKSSVVSRALRSYENIHEVTVHTGQHFDANMSDVFFTDLDISPPAYELNIHGGHHGAMTGRMMIEVEKVLLSESPDAVLVYGDTNSTLAGALCAAKLELPVAHVEAGLRSFNMSMPEEVNRILTDRISHWLFTPTETAATNLLKEGIQEARITPVGDVMFDVALHYGSKLGAHAGILATLGLGPQEYVLATIHRQENTDCPERLGVIAKALFSIAEEKPVVWPMHPRTRDKLQKFGLLETVPKKLHIIEPVGYLDMVRLEKSASAIATDSGGVQKEAFFHRVPCVTIRDETEWVELIDAGWNRLVSPGSAQEVAAEIANTIGTKGKSLSAYGEGDAANKIVEKLIKDLR